MDKNAYTFLKMFALLSIVTYTSKEKICNALDLFKDQGGILRTSDVLSAGIHPRTLYKLRDAGYITKLDRGVYKLNNYASLSYPDFAIVAARIQKAKICLLSALDFHLPPKGNQVKVHLNQNGVSTHYNLSASYRFREACIS